MLAVMIFRDQYNTVRSFWSWDRDVVITRQEPLLEPRRAACCLMHVVGFSYSFVLQNGMSGAPIACWPVRLGCGVCVGAGGFGVGCFGGGFGDGTSFRERSSTSAATAAVGCRVLHYLSFSSMTPPTGLALKDHFLITNGSFLLLDLKLNILEKVVRLSPGRRPQGHSNHGHANNRSK